MKAKLLLHRKYTDEEGDLFELVVWSVAVSGLYQEGVRYRMAFVLAGMGKPVILYDNHHPKGHHKHIEGVEHLIDFSGVEKLLQQFERDVYSWKKQRGIIQ